MNMCVNINSWYTQIIVSKLRDSSGCTRVGRRGAPHKHHLQRLVEAFLFRLKTALPLRFISALFLIPLTTLFRHCQRFALLFKVDPAKAKEQNRQMSLQRVKIEHLFARLKTWRIIHHYFPQKPETYSTIFKAIAFIHNQAMMGKC